MPAVGKGTQLVPREDDVIAVDDHALTPGMEQLRVLGIVRTGRGVAHGGCILRAADGAELALQDLLELAVIEIEPAAKHPRRILGCGLLLAEAGVEMHIIAHTIPRDDRARTVGAKDAVRRVVKVARGLVAALCNDFLRVVAGIVARDGTRDASAPARVRRDLSGIIAHRAHRRAAREHSHVAVRLRRGKRAAHEAHIADRAADLFGRHLDTKGIVRLKQNALGLHESLPHGAPRRLPEIAALGVLDMRTPGEQRDLYIRQRRAGEHAAVALFGQMREDQALPVPVEHVLAAGGVKRQPRAALGGLEQQVHLGIVAQRLEMSHALDRRRDRLLIQDAAGIDLHVHIEPLTDEAFEHLDLHRAHELDVNLAQCLVPDDVQLRVFLLKLTQARQKRARIHIRRQTDAVGQHRLE